METQTWLSCHYNITIICILNDNNPHPVFGR